MIVHSLLNLPLHAGTPVMSWHNQNKRICMVLQMPPDICRHDYMIVD